MIHGPYNIKLISAGFWKSNLGKNIDKQRVSILSLEKEWNLYLPKNDTLVHSLPCHINITECHSKHTHKCFPWLAWGNQFRQKLPRVYKRRISRENCWEQKQNVSGLSRPATGIRKYFIFLSTYSPYFFYVKNILVLVSLKIHECLMRIIQILKNIFKGNLYLTFIIYFFLSSVIIWLVIFLFF